MHGTRSRVASGVLSTLVSSTRRATKTVTSLLRCLCSSLARDTLLRSDPSYHGWRRRWLKSLRASLEVLATLRALTLVVGVESEFFRARSCFKRRCFFFSFQIFLLEVSPFSDHEECGGLYWAETLSDGSSQGSQVNKAWDSVLSKGFSRRSQVEEAWNLATIVEVSRLLCRQRWSISRGGRLEAIDCFFRLVRPNCLVSSRLVPTKGWHPSQKNRMRSGLSGALSASNSMDWGCSRWDAQLWTSSHWEFRLTLLQILSSKALELPRLFRREVWTQPTARELWLPGSDACAGARKTKS